MCYRIKEYFEGKNNKIKNKRKDLNNNTTLIIITHYERIIINTLIKLTNIIFLNK